MKTFLKKFQPNLIADTRYSVVDRGRVFGGDKSNMSSISESEQYFSPALASWQAEIRVTLKVLALMLPLILIVHSSSAVTRPLPTTEALGAIIVAHFQAIERNDLEGAMSYFHRQAPGLENIKTELEFNMSGYLQTVGRFTFSEVDLLDRYAVIQVTHSFIAITGLKFINGNVDSTYRFKQEGGQWKIWSEQDL